MTETSTYKRTVSKIAIVTCVIGVLGFAEAAYGQVDEIVTTAQRQSQSVQDAPVAVTVITTDELETKQIADSIDIQNFVPNLNIGTNTGTANAARIFLRGVGEDESRGAVEPAVGTYVDGVYLGRTVGALFDLVDLEQVEVLRGPQGTLYGRNSNGGAIKISTVKPQAENDVTAKFTYGNYDRLEARGMVNFAMGDATAVRLSGLYRTREGFFEVMPNGAAAGESRDDVGEIDTLAFRGAISHDFGDWNILLSADYTEDDSDPIPSSIIDSADADGNLFTIEPAPGASCFASSLTEITAFDFRPIGCFAAHRNETKARGVSGTITGNLGNHTVQSITASRKLNDDLQSHIGFAYAQQTDQDQFSQEITLSSNLDGAFNYVVGGYYWNEDLVLDSIFVFPFRVAADTESFAVFGQGIFDISDRASITAGLRYTDESRSFDGVNLTTTLSNSDDNDFDNLSYTAKLDYDLTDGLMVYASYATGFKGSGFSPDCFGAAACFLPVDKETVDTIEVGFRSQFWDNRMQFNGTFFNSQYDDLQIAATVPGLGFTRFNVDETEIQGLEFDMRFRPNERFELVANLGLLDGEYKALTISQAGGLSNAGASCPGGVVTIDCALGLDLKNAPDYKANIAANYTHPFEGGDLTISGDISFEDDSFNLVANSPASAFTDIPTLINARIAYQPDDSFWNVALWAKNLTDEEYFRAGTATGLAVYASAPATYGIDIGFDF